MDIAALAVLVIVATVSVWALRRRPPAQALADFIEMWSRPWGRQVIVDFYGLELVLVLWMATHASEAGSWAAFGVCVAAMPIFGAMAAAAYWLLAVV
jgi:hypothetical protein